MLTTIAIKLEFTAFDTKEEAEKVFIAGQRKALGTTDEVGMSKTFFANPFGPDSRTRKD